MLMFIAAQRSEYIHIEQISMDILRFFATFLCLSAVWSCYNPNEISSHPMPFPATERAG